MSSVLDRLKSRAGAVTDAREVEIPLAKIMFDPNQPRQAFHHIDGRVDPKDEAYIDELAATIKSQGLMQAITVEEIGDGNYRVVVGECRTRAHLLLGYKTIRSTINNGLKDSKSKRLVYQLIENVSRKDLKDAEMAEKIGQLLKGIDGEPPLNQAEIAKLFGKSEGWVTRYVKFGSDEMQRVWVLSGIVDTVENLYRVSILPQSFQVELRRRVDLPEDDPEYLSKPLDRKLIDEMSRQAKIAKSTSSQVAMQQQVSQPTAPSTGEGSAAANTGFMATGNGVARDDSTGQTLAALAAQGRQEGVKGVAANLTSNTGAVEKYQLPADDRQAILRGLAQTGGQAVPTTGVTGQNAPVLPPVNCRASLSNVRALLTLLDGNEDARDAFDTVQCSLNLPGALAQLVANQLTGMVVDQKEVAAVMQTELARLQ